MRRRTRSEKETYKALALAGAALELTARGAALDEGRMRAARGTAAKKATEGLEGAPAAVLARCIEANLRGGEGNDFETLHRRYGLCVDKNNFGRRKKVYAVELLRALWAAGARSGAAKAR